MSSLGVDLSKLRSSGSVPVDPIVPAPSQRRTVDVRIADDFPNLVRQAEGYLARADIDLNRDPLLQALDSSEVAEIDSIYKSNYGDVNWTESDYLVIMLAGFVATLLDVFLVRIPGDTMFLGKMQQGSPLTEWLRENSKPVHEHILSRLEKYAKVPYDLPTSKEVDGLHPKVHRLMSLGHDPILGFIFGVIDIVSGTGTFIDKNGYTPCP